MKHKKFNNNGQALLTLLVIVVIAVVILGGAVSMSAINSQTSSGFAVAQEAENIAEAGIENALIELLRDTSYTGDVLTIGNGTAIINVSGNDPYTIVSIGQTLNYIRTKQVVASYSGNVLTINSWQEIN